MPDLKIRAINRNQYFMETINLEGMVAEDDAGCPAHNPKVLLSIWIYAYSQGVSSAREVERLSKEIKTWRWLSGCVTIVILSPKGEESKVLSDEKLDSSRSLS